MGKFHSSILTLMVSFTIIGIVSAEETVGCPHTIGKGKFKIRGKTAHIYADKVYSDEVWKAFHSGSPYSSDYDKMVDLPEGWHQKLTVISVGMEYGLTDRLSVGIYIPYVMKDLKRQVWSSTQNKTVWKEIKEKGLNDLWISGKYLVYSASPGLLGFDWKDGLLLAVAYKPPITSDEEVKNGIGSGTHDFKFVVLSHPHFTEKFFLCSDMYFQYRGKVKTIEGFSKSEWDLGDKFGYRYFLGFELSNNFVILGGPQGWIAMCNKDKDGNKLEDSNTYSHGVVFKLRWQPLGEEDAGSIDVGVRIPYECKVSFAPDFAPFVGARIKF